MAADRRPDLDGPFRLNPEYVAATFDGEVLLYRLGDGRTLTLNRTAGVILDLIDGRCSAAEIREVMRRAFPGSPAAVGRDVDRTLRYLLRNRAVEAVGSGATEAEATRGCKLGGS